MTDDDRDLRARFAALRQEDEAHRPDFSVVWSETSGRRRPPREGVKLAAAAVALVAIATAIVFLRSPRQRSTPQAVRPATSITEWKAPTDFLLETPGREVLRTVPEIGRVREYSARPGRRQRPAGRKSSLNKEES